MPVQMQPIASSDVAAAGYDEERMLMVVEFIKSGVYTYFNVTPKIWQAFIDAPSKGRFINFVFKASNWPYQKGTVLEPLGYE